MSLLDLLTGKDGQQGLGQIAKQLGLGQAQANDGLKSLLPFIMKALQKNTRSQGGLESLLGALGRGNHERYLDRPEELGTRETEKDGNGILGHIFGSKDVSREVAGHAAQKSGLDAGVLKKMLPQIAAMVMGGLKKESQSGGLLGALGGGGAGSAPSGASGLLGKLLDADGDGQIHDDLLSMAGKLFR